MRIEDGSKVVGGVFADDNPDLGGGSRHGVVEVVRPSISIATAIASLPVCQNLLTKALCSLHGPLDGVLVRRLGDRAGLLPPGRADLLAAPAARVIRNGARHDEGGMRHALLTALAGAALLAGCGGDDEGGARSATATDTIRIKEFLYSPRSATVKAGQAISVPNADDAPHTLTDRSPKRAFDSGTIKGRETGKVTFGRPGTFEYFCELHPYMKGTVTVTR